MKGHYIIFAILILLIIISGYFCFRYYQENKELKLQVLELTQEVYDLKEQLKESEEIADWKTYISKKYSISFAYPRNYQLIENSLSGWLDYYIEDPIPFRLRLLQDIYTDYAQTPEINLEIAKTSETISQVLDRLKEKINEDAKALENPESLYYGADPPEIKSTETVTIGNLKMVKVVRYLGPGGPNPMLLEYCISHSGHVFVFSANYSISCDPKTIGDCGATEKETLPVILSTFKFIE